MSLIADRSTWVRRPALLTAPASILLALLGLIAMAAPASAHATLLSTDPQHDALLTTAPESVTLTFDEPVSVWDTSVTVFDPDGERLDVDARAVDATVVASLPADLGQGSYSVNWRVISADDHPVSGGFTFSIGVRTQSVAPNGNDASGGLNLARLSADALSYLGLLGAVGIGVFELLILDATPGAMPLLRRRLRVARRCLTAIGIAGFALSPVLSTAWQQAGSFSDLGRGSVWSDAFSSHAAVSMLLAVLGLAIANIGTDRCVKGGSVRSLGGGLAVVGVLIAVAALPWVGHTRTYGPAWLLVAADVAHVVAAAIWIGGVSGLVLTLWRGSDASAPRAASTAARFSALAAWTVVALAVAGTVLAWRVMGSIEDLWLTSYGRALMVKVAVVGVVVVVAGWNRRVLLPRLVAEPRSGATRGRLRTALLVEAAGLVAVLAVTSVLVTQSPGVGSGGSGREGAGVARGIEKPLGDGLARVRVSPLLPGRNVVQLYLRDADGEPTKVIGVPSVRFANESEDLGPLSVELTRVGPGQFEGTVDLAVAGRWDVDVSARTSRYEAPIATMSFTVG